MAVANVKGTFISASLKTSEFEGKKSYSTQLDIYQKDSPRNDKMVSVKVEDAELLQMFNDNFSMGDEISVNVIVNAYKGQCYFKYLSIA